MLPEGLPVARHITLSAVIDSEAMIGGRLRHSFGLPLLISLTLVTRLVIREDSGLGMQSQTTFYRHAAGSR